MFAGNFFGFILQVNVGLRKEGSPNYASAGTTSAGGQGSLIEIGEYITLWLSATIYDVDVFCRELDVAEIVS